MGVHSQDGTAQMPESHVSHHFSLIVERGVGL